MNGTGLISDRAIPNLTVGIIPPTPGCTGRFQDQTVKMTGRYDACGCKIRDFHGSQTVCRGAVSQLSVIIGAPGPHATITFFWRPYIEKVIYRYLDCGDLSHGFTRVKCKDCGHEYLLAFSCKRRHFCPTCHQKRVVEFGE